MTRKALANKTGKPTGKHGIDSDAVSDTSGESWGENREFDERWINATARDRDRSRIQRQMKARRELERLRDEKRLRQLVADWPFDD